MKESPFFSIILPTKNRSQLVSDAINSVLEQTFENFELIVVDNDDSELTKEVVRTFSDPRIIYRRTGNLSMVENWEAGRVLASGKYLTVLEDKLSYYPCAFDYLHKIIVSSAAEIIVWGVGAFNEAILCSFKEHSYEKVESEKLIFEYVSGLKVWKSLPRIINSLVSRNIVEDICKKNGSGAFFNYASPDLVAAFSQLAVVSELYVIAGDLEFHRSSVSNASDIRKDKVSALSYFSGNSGFILEDAVSLVPIKNPCMVHNTIYNDYLNVRAVFSGKLQKHTMSNYEYARLCLKDVVSTLFRGGDIHNELTDVYKYMNRNLSMAERFKLWFWWARVILRKLLTKYTPKSVKKVKHWLLKDA